MRAVVCWGITEIECRFWHFDCLFRKFNVSPDWLLNFECRLLNFQRSTLYYYLLSIYISQGKRLFRPEKLRPDNEMLSEARKLS